MLSENDLELRYELTKVLSSRWTLTSCQRDDLTCWTFNDGIPIHNELRDVQVSKVQAYVINKAGPDGHQLHHDNEMAIFPFEENAIS